MLEYLYYVAIPIYLFIAYRYRLDSKIISGAVWIAGFVSCWVVLKLFRRNDPVPIEEKNN